MEIIRKKISEMNRAAYNPRIDLHEGDPEYNSLRDSLSRFGAVLPVVWNKRTNNVVGGHQRLTVLSEMGITEVDVSVVDLPLIKEKELNVVLNKSDGRWDVEKLQNLLDELGDRATETGFSESEIETMQNKIDQMLDNGFVQEEQLKIDRTFNLSLSFNSDDREEISGYIKENGKKELVRVIIETASGGGN